MKKFLLWFVGILPGLFLVFVIIGLFASENFEGTETRVINTSKEKI